MLRGRRRGRGRCRGCSEDRLGHRQGLRAGAGLQAGRLSRSELRHLLQRHVLWPFQRDRGHGLPDPDIDLVANALGAVVESADLLQQVMPFLDSITRDHKTIFALCEKVGNVEQSADESFDAGLSRIRAELGTGALNVVGYIDRKELYELIERVVDKCDDVANVVQTVTAKHV